MENQSVRPGEVDVAFVGASVGDGRYQIVEHLGVTPYGTMFRATDTQSSTTVRLLVLSEPPQNEEQLSTLTRQVERASRVSHPNLLKVFEVITGPTGCFVASEDCQGTALNKLWESKRSTGQGFAPKQVLTIALQICEGALACQSIGAHGSICLESITVDQRGTVKIGNTGLAGFLPKSTPHPSTLAPELTTESKASSEADVFGVGAIVYQLLVGASIGKGCRRPSVAVPGISELVDEFVSASTKPDPHNRPKLEQLPRALKKALSASAPEKQSADPVPKTTSLAQTIGDAPVPNLTDTTERWLISKGRLDYGPFSFSEVVSQIENDEIVPGNMLVDNETGERIDVAEHPLLASLVNSAKQRRDDARRAEAEVAHAKQEKSRGTIVYATIAAAIVLVFGGGYFVVKTVVASDTSTDTSKLAALEGASLEATITFPDDEAVKKRRRKVGKKRGGAKGSAGTGGDWDESLDLDLAAGGGSDHLENNQVNPVIQANGNKLARCLRSTKSSEAFIEFMVKGTGKVYQVRVNFETDTPLAKCLRKAMMSLQFPTFDGVRSKHNFTLSF